jgi:hypothetical protein
MGTVRGSVYERTETGGIGQSIGGAEITFQAESSDRVETVIADADGTYGISLPADRYVASATYEGYEDFSTAPGFVVVSETGVQTFNVFMKPGRESTSTGGPTVTDFAPVSGHGGTKLTISGTGFSPVPSENEVVVGGKPARVIEAKSSRLEVLVDSGAQTGPVDVTVAGGTDTGPGEFTVEPYPDPAAGEDGPPIHFAGDGQPGERPGGTGAAAGAGRGAGDLSASGTTDVLVSLVRPTDKSPSDGSAARQNVVDKWDSVDTYFEQASYGDMTVNTTVTGDWHELTGDEDTYVDYRSDREDPDDPWESNVKPGVTGRLRAEAAQAAVDEGYDLGEFDAFVATLFLNGSFIRAWNLGGKQNFSYSDSSSGVDIDISLDSEVNTMLLNETADWGRCAHELAHGLVNAPANLDADGSAVLDEDIYDSSLVPDSAASAEQFDLMGAHDDHPLFSAYFMTQLDWYEDDNTHHVRTIEWDDNATSKTYEIVAHGDKANTNNSRCHVVEIEVSDGLSYFVEVRQRPTDGDQVFDDSIPLDGVPDQGGVVVTKVLSDTVESNQVMRFLTLLHDDARDADGTIDVEVLGEGDTATDATRDIEIEVTTHGVETDPLICEVSVEWAQNIDPDPDSNFNLTIEPWDTDTWETPDIWVDRKPYGSFDNEKDAAGRPKGNGDTPLPASEVDDSERDKAIHRFTARIENEGSEKAENVDVTYATVDPPGVGDNGNWAPIRTVTIPEIDADDYVEEYVEWVPVVGEHTCLKVEIARQQGEKAFGKNRAQENIFDFEAKAESIPATVTMETAVRNPLDRQALVLLTARNVPEGYVVHFPHQWLWLDAHEERTHELTVVPTQDYSNYLDMHGDEPTAPIRLDGAVPHHYTEEVSPGTVPPSWLEPIGGVTMNVTPKRTVDLELEVANRGEQTVELTGTMTPAMDDQQVSVGLRDPHDGYRVAETTTDTGGEFTVLFDLADPLEGRLGEDGEGFVPGMYRGQAFTASAANAAHTESNRVHFEMAPDPAVEVDDPEVSPPDGILEMVEDVTTTITRIVSGAFSAVTGGDRTPTRRTEPEESDDTRSG